MKYSDFLYLELLIRGVEQRLTLLIEERDSRYRERFEAQAAQVTAAFDAAQTANHKAETSVDKRLELLNELRVGVATTEQIEAMEKITNALTARLNLIEGRSSGLHYGWQVAVAVLTLVLLLSGVAVAVLL